METDAETVNQVHQSDAQHPKVVGMRKPRALTNRDRRAEHGARMLAVYPTVGDSREQYDSMV